MTNASAHDKQSQKELQLQSQVHSFRKKESQLELDNSKAQEKLQALQEEVGVSNELRSKLEEQITRLIADVETYKSKCDECERALNVKSDQFRILEEQNKTLNDSKQELTLKLEELTSLQKTQDAFNVEHKDWRENLQNQNKSLSAQNKDLERTVQSLGAKKVELEAALKSSQAELKSKQNGNQPPANKSTVRGLNLLLVIIVSDT